MAKELFVSSTPHETKVAIVEEDQLAEIYFERENEYTLAGSIYKGRVTRVLPGMQSAFVNIGLERDAFLYVSDFLLDEEDAEGLEQVVSRPRGEGREPQPREEAETPLEAQDIFPESGGPAEEEKASPSGEAHQGEAEEHEGARKWRGRRRRRGRGGRFQERGEREAGAQPVRESRPEAAPSGEEPIVLPGESISKYQPPAAKPRTAAPATPTPSRPRPSTEYSIQGTQFKPGSMVLPGESIAKYRGERGPSAPAEVQVEEHRSEPAEFDSATDAGQHEEFAPAPLHIEHQEHHTEMDSEEALVAPEAEHAEESEIEGEDDFEERFERPADESRFEQMNVASVFGGEAAEAPSEEQTETAAASAQDREEAEATEQQPWIAPGRGQVEEEEIEEEEADLPSFEEHFDLGEFEELEEEVLGPVDDQFVPLGNELTEAVRDAHINERATGDYETEGLGPNGQMEEAEETEEDDFEARVEQELMAGELEPEEEPTELEEAQAEQRAASGTAGYQQRADRRGERRGRRPGRRMRGRPARHHAQRALPAISDLLKEGQEILVQIAKEPIAKKGARITSHIALPGRFLVYMPTVHHTGVSRKIASDEERQRLKRIVMSERGDSAGGFIVRTAAAGAHEDDLRADIRFLINIWNEIRTRSESSKAPSLIYHDLNLVERILRDQVTTSFSSIWVDTEQEYERILRFVSRFQPSLVKRVKLYTKETPLFEQFNISDEINKALKSKVWLKSGGYIVINQTEALVAIDINTGKYVGKTARLEDTIVKTNIDAIKEIVRQIRLRDLGGIIVIDFIDMDERKNRHKVMQALEEALKADRAPSKVLQFNDFGLVAITRKRVKQSLERTLGQPCPTCSATGMIKSTATVCNEIYVEMRKMSRHFERDVMLRANPEVAKALKANGARWLQEMEELTGRTILVKSDPLLHPEQFDIQ